MEDRIPASGISRLRGRIPLLLTALILTAAGIPAGIHSGELLYTDLSGNLLYTAERCISSAPGSGRNTVSGECLFWKECQPGECQRVKRSDGRTVFQREYFSGPFPSPSGSGFMLSVPDEILVLDNDGRVIESFFTGEYPGSLASGAGMIWFVSSRDGNLKRLDPATGRISPVLLDFIPLTVQFGSGMLLLEDSSGGYFLCRTDGGKAGMHVEGFMARFTDENCLSVCRWRESDGCETREWEIASIDLETLEVSTSQLQADPGTGGSVSLDDPAAHFDVPYMHQRWDTPDWFNGSSSCGPTSCMMGTQYYDRLTPDSIWCSYPEGHWSQWGNYIPVQYTFLGSTYDIQGLSPGGVWVPGAHGFICRDLGAAYWSYMVLWMEQHGLEADYLGTTWSALTSELDSSWPVVASTTSAYTSGHILLFNGYYDNHSVICNDAYGNQNEPGWGNYYNGKDVVYDWPGYNNGNTQLGISQLFSARSQVLAPQGTLIDDRTHGYRKLGPCQYWHEQTTGYGGFSWWTYSTGALPDTCLVEWIPELPAPGAYSIQVYVPSSHSTATGIYHVMTASGWQTAYLNQSAYSGQWAALGTWDLVPSTAMVKAGDYTGTQGQYISFDAMEFTLETSCVESAPADQPAGFSPEVNPVRFSSGISFYTPEGSSGTIRVYDTTGREVASTSGNLPGECLPPGIYIAVLKNGGEVLITRFTVIH